MRRLHLWQFPLCKLFEENGKNVFLSCLQVPGQIPLISCSYYGKMLSCSYELLENHDSVLFNLEFSEVNRIPFMIQIPPRVTCGKGRSQNTHRSCLVLTENRCFWRSCDNIKECYSTNYWLILKCLRFW